MGGEEREFVFPETVVKKVEVLRQESRRIRERLVSYLQGVQDVFGVPKDYVVDLKVMAFVPPEQREPTPIPEPGPDESSE